MCVLRFIGKCCTFWILGNTVEGYPNPNIFKDGSFLRRLTTLLALVVGFPIQVWWWGFPLYCKVFYYFGIQGKMFELNYEELLRTHVQGIRGVLHIGANIAQEAKLYKDVGIMNVVWIEAQPKLEERIRNTLEVQGLVSKHKVLMAALWNKSGEKIKMTITDNSISSSLLPLGKGHHKCFPFVLEDESSESQTIVETITLDDLFENMGFTESAMNYNFIYLDVQGSELRVLQGCDNTLSNIDFIMSEVSSEEHYVGGTLINELDDFLQTKSFRRVNTALPPFGHGNALYVRQQPTD